MLSRDPASLSSKSLEVLRPQLFLESGDVSPSVPGTNDSRYGGTLLLGLRESGYLYPLHTHKVGVQIPGAHLSRAGGIEAEVVWSHERSPNRSPAG